MFHRCLSVLALLTAAAAGRALDPIPFLPAETDAVVTIQAKQLAESELMQKVGPDLLKTLLKSSKQAAEALEATGLDPMKDFDRIVVGIDADKTDPPKPFALLEGKFDIKKVTAAVDDYAAKNPTKVSAVKVLDKPAYKITGKNDNETMYSAVISDTLLVVAPSEQALAGAFEAAAGSRKAVISKELAGVIAGTKSTAPIFVQAWVKGKFASLNVPNEQLKQRLQGVDWATATVTVTKDMALNVVINTPDAAAAKQLSDLLGGVVLLLKLQAAAAAEDQPELKFLVDLLRTTRVNPKDKTVVVTGVVHGSDIEKAMKAEPAAPKKK